MSDLADFLRARLDEDEAAAKAAWPGPWQLKEEHGLFRQASVCVMQPLSGRPGASTGLTAYVPLGSQDAETAAHIARHDPARVLREVAAKRAIIDLHTPTATLGPGRSCEYCGHLWPCAEALAVAAVYSDHPDYDPAWAV